MKDLPHSVCKICGKPRGRYFNHIICSKKLKALGLPKSRSPRNNTIKKVDEFTTFMNGKE